MENRAIKMKMLTEKCLKNTLSSQLLKKKIVFQS